MACPHVACQNVAVFADAGRSLADLEADVMRLKLHERESARRELEGELGRMRGEVEKMRGRLEEAERERDEEVRVVRGEAERGI